MKKLKQKVDRDLCKHAYNDTIEAVSRLAAYATSRSLKILGHGEYYTVAENLCRKDLLILGISARRFAEISQTTSSLKSRNVRISDQVSKEAGEKKSDSAWNIIGNIIHGNEITIFKELGKLEYAADRIDIFTSVTMTEEFDAAISIKSDKFERKYFILTDLLGAINSYIEEVSDSIDGVYLGSAYEI
ncbi:hypothetical protein RRU01S_04_01180 [Agrobacterium rubi TR3 = NBRC 13261]|uniref:Uncharacterized protein n=1 Tax=Agrobacterium rubi TR3 = NBRC 13261 TaxID=1368415 RepID=A0A081CRK0_9HYPH|nr:hypothetical protein [Agrobacterium rubi]MBP1876896.1 hypothetical protein [Agrobacterium rubi]MCL6651085.1 hypothetical protein [Agrobacterium rubi]GAK69296.1 hypothetical protein RRU01S_04_01180 [Agrobacterium rubi TR3 = NBRC 13261]